MAGATQGKSDTQSIIDAAMSLAAAEGWAELSMHRIAAEAGVAYGELCRLLRSKSAILAAFAAQIDHQLETACQVDAEEPARDRLFEVLMERFELLRPYRSGLAAIGYDLRMDATGLAALWKTVANSMGKVLKIAQVEPPMLTRSLQVQGLVAVYARVLSVFMKDESDDLAATMKALDKELAEAERWAKGMNDLFDRFGNLDALFRRFDSAAKSAPADVSSGATQDQDNGTIIDGEASQAT